MRSANELKLTSKWPSMRRRFWNSTRPCTTNVSPITLSGVCIVMLELSLDIITLGAAVVVTTTGLGSCCMCPKSAGKRGEYTTVSSGGTRQRNGIEQTLLWLCGVWPLSAFRLDAQRVANSEGNNPKKTHLRLLLLLLLRNSPTCQQLSYWFTVCVCVCVCQTRVHE